MEINTAQLRPLGGSVLPVVKTLPMLDSNTEKELRLRVLNVLFLLNDFSETMPLRYRVQLSIATNVA